MKKHKKPTHGLPVKTTSWGGHKQSQKPGTPRNNPSPDLPPNFPLRAFCICLGLIAGILIIYLQSCRYGYIAFDDDIYAYKNTRVLQGLTPSNIFWAFTTLANANWHPLTWLSLMLDGSLFGPGPGAHHIVNMLLHCASSLALFFALVTMSRRVWAGALVAAVFAFHPLHVESVAWVSERKDVLSALLGIVSLWSYICYAQKPKAWKYLLTALALALGLLAKPMLVTLPFVFLLLDFWPLGRLRFPLSARRLAGPLIEKAPLLAMAVASSIVTGIAQARSGAISSLVNIPLPARIANALVAAAAYIFKTLWPAKLGLLYPYQAQPAVEVLGAVAFLAVITLAALYLRKKQPAILVGWLWYLGMLVPVIGLVQVGSQSMADRYAYLPLIGLSIAVVWGVSDLVKGRKAAGILASVVACVAAAFLIIGARTQAGYWKSSEAIFGRTLAVTRNNSVMNNNLGMVLSDSGRYDEAEAHCRAALAINPNYAEAYNNLGMVYSHRQMTREAGSCFERALAIKADYAEVYNNLGVVQARQGLFRDALASYQRAIGLKPDYAEAYANLGHELLQQGNLRESYRQLAEALRLSAQSDQAQGDMGLVLAAQGNYGEAAGHLEQSLRINPAQPEVHSNLGFVLQRIGRYDEAVAHCNQAISMNAGQDAYYNLATALAAQGKKDQAAAEFSRILARDPNNKPARTALMQMQGVHGK